MPKTTRIEIPASSSDLIALAGNIQTKHTADGKNSPLDGLDWEKYDPIITQATVLDKQIGDLNKQTEQLIQQRNLLEPDLYDFVRSARDVLQGVYRQTLRKLLDWGFNVDDTPKAAAKIPAKATVNA